jgi:hypothetical protein
MSAVYIFLLAFIVSCGAQSPKCNPTRLFDAMLVLTSDGVKTNPFPDIIGFMPPERDTIAYRTRCGNFYRVMFGLDFFDALNEVGPPPNGTLLLKISALFYEIYAASLPFGSHMPATNGHIYDDGYGILITSPIRVHGLWGGPEGRILNVNDQLNCGEYHPLYDNDIPIMAPFLYQSARPHVVSYLTEAQDFFDSNIWIECSLFSPEYGIGVASGVINFRRQPDGRVGHSHRNVVTFPRFLRERESAPKVKECQPYGH